MTSRHRLDPDSEVFVDGLRGVLAIAVLVSHAFDLGIRQSFGHDVPAMPLFWRTLHSTVGHGGFYVWGFFVISGLCIHQSIARDMARGAFQWARYLYARVTRLYPLHLLALLVAVIALPHGAEITANASVHPWRQLVATLFMLHGFTDAFPGFDPSWTLANEAAYYVVWPLALLLGAGSLLRAACISVLMTVVPALGVAVLWWVGGVSGSTVLNGVWVIGVLFPTWLAGAALAMNWQRVCQWVTFRRWVLGIAMCVLNVAMVSVLKFYDTAPTFIDPLSVVSIPGWVIVLAGGRHLKLAINEKLALRCKRLGLLSYPCYILHMPLMCLTDWAVVTFLPSWLWAPPMARIAWLLLPSALILGGLGSWVEARLLKWRAGAIERVFVKPVGMAM
ncbi:MAG: acyltransferase [Verrucomicrobiaceae bacterium]|nr:acyltransferase [Verrucomicrobiaceae bacterium]